MQRTPVPALRLRYDSAAAGQAEAYSDFLQEQVIRDQVPELLEERAIAEACGYGFVVGVSSASHRAALLAEDRRLDIVVTGCPR